MTTHSAIRFGACCMTLAAGLFSAPPPAHAGSEKIIYAFKGGLDGQSPVGGLTKLGDRLYGVTYYGGASGFGTIFYVKLDGTHHIIHSFYRNQQTDIGLVYLGGRFYGVMTYGGSKFKGAIYSISPGGNFSLVYSFVRGSGGIYPVGTLVSMGGSLYGVTADGGVNGYGAVFTVSPQGVERIIHDFCNDPMGGHYPNALISDGTTLYGTTTNGGNDKCTGYGCGTVYSLTPQGIFTEIYSSFDGAGTGSGNPFGRLLKVGDELYGAALNTEVKLPHNSMVYKVSLAGVLHKLQLFDDQSDKAGSGLAKLRNALYGVTYRTIYSITDGVFSSLYTFQPGEGEGGSDLLSVKGSLYGEAGAGGGPSYGSIFSYTP